MGFTVPFEWADAGAVCAPTLFEVRDLAAEALWARVDPGGKAEVGDGRCRGGAVRVKVAAWARTPNVCSDSGALME